MEELGLSIKFFLANIDPAAILFPHESYYSLFVPPFT
jgi:hypothetical protein